MQAEMRKLVQLRTKRIKPGYEAGISSNCLKHEARGETKLINKTNLCSANRLPRWSQTVTICA